MTNTGDLCAPSPFAQTAHAQPPKGAFFMKTIVCYGDSNTWGCPPMLNWDSVERIGRDQRWTGVLRNTLGDGYLVIEEGLNGRTTVNDDPFEGLIPSHKNGLTYLYPCLESHKPFDLITIMLGTNNLKVRFSLTAFDIAEGARRLVEVAMGSDAGPNNRPPQVLLICPPPVSDNLAETTFVDLFEGALEKSRAMAKHFAETARRTGCHFMNAGVYIESSRVDGIHFEVDQHTKLGAAVAAKVREILG
jgi:lysophospholipase L1-like esterase